MDKKTISKEELIELYEVQKLPLKEVCNRLNVKTTYLYKYLRKNNITLRKRTGFNINKSDLIDLYINQKKSISEIALINNTTEDAIKHTLIRFRLDDQMFLNSKGEALNFFTPIQEQIILGSLLGDASLSQHSNSVRFKITHCAKQKKYVQYKYDNLKSLIEQKELYYLKRLDVRTNSENETYSFKTRCNKLFIDLYPLFYKEEIAEGKSVWIKYVNMEILNKLDDRGLAIWFMDDGYKNGPNILGLSTQGFDKEDLNIIALYFKTKWNIIVNITPTKKIEFQDVNSWRFQQTIKPHILDSFKYKLMERP